MIGPVADATMIGTANSESAQEQPVDALPGSVATKASLRLERNGVLSVTEQITVPAGPAVTRTVALRQSAGDSADRVFSVTGARVEGQGSATVNGDEFVLTLNPGVSTVKYVVTGAVADSSDHEEVRWQVESGWNVPVDKADISFIAPEVTQAITCLAGPVGSSTPCEDSQIGHTQSVRARHFGLKPGDRIDLSIKLRPGAVPANMRLEPTFDLARSFALTPASAAGLAGLGLLLIGGLGLLWYTRGRDTRALESEIGPVEVLMTDEVGNVSFASPDGVLPGQVGTVIDEHVDVVDVTATVIDLAVRNYLWIEELPENQHGTDWRIVRLNAPDESLRPYERAVYELLLGVGETARQEVLLSQLRAGKALDLTSVRTELYADVVDKSWFSRRPDTERNLFWWVGCGLSVAGVGLTVSLALTTTLALLGAGVVLGGIALASAARLMPARTGRGSALVAQMRGLRGYLHTVTADSLPEKDREMVFSRSLPYAIVLGLTDRWLAEFAELDPSADGTPGLYWYGELVEDSGHVIPNLRRFRGRFPGLVAAMDGVIAQAGHLRRIKPA